VVVTGASGRLGRSVVAVLHAAGHQVHAVDRMRDPGSGATQHTIDLADGADVRRLFAELRPEAIVHLAAIAVPFSAPESVILETNVALAFSVFEAAVEAGAQRVLAASSPTVIGYGSPTGWTPQSLPIDETHPLAPWNAYALSKQVIENAVAMAARGFGKDARFGFFRPCFVITPEEWEGAPTQQGHSVRDRLEHPELAAVSLFNYVDARDAGEFVRCWLESDADLPNGTGFFVGAADALALDPLAELLPRYLPESAALAASLTGTAPAFSSERAATLLGWRPARGWRDELRDELRDDTGSGTAATASP
jgi:UDP-glucose 4-epimerase